MMFLTTILISLWGARGAGFPFLLLAVKIIMDLYKVVCLPPPLLSRLFFVLLAFFFRRV